MSSDDVTVQQYMDGSIETWDGVRQSGTALSVREVAALRAHFAAERVMPEDVQELVKSVRERVDDVMQGNQTGRSDSIFNLAIQLTAALEAAYSEPEYKMPGHDEVLDALNRLTILKGADRG